MLNRKLADKFGLDAATRRKIAARHGYRKTLERRIANGAPLLDAWTANEFALQELWGFPRDAQYHTFWRMEGCTCPKLDNDDDCPHTKHINLACPIHGAEHARQTAHKGE